MIATAPAEDPQWLGRCRQLAALPKARFERRLSKLSGQPDQQRALLRARFRFDVRGCLKFCLPEQFALPWNGFHRRFLDPEKRHWRGRKTTREAWAAPRGIAKTTCAKGDAAHDTMYALEAFTVILSAGTDDAMGWSDTVRDWFESPTPQMDWLYGPFELTGGKELFQVSGAAGARGVFASRSFRSKVRGINHLAQRPTKIVVDDGEDRQRVENPRLRGIDQRFVTDDVLKAGPKEGGTRFVWVGTVLHPSAQLATMLERREPYTSWTATKFKAVLSWPVRTDLWDRCRKLYTDLTGRPQEVREAAARAFYEARQAEMDEGAEVLDQHALPIFDCFRAIWDEGLASFLRERQNEPLDPSARLFTSSEFTRFRIVHDPAEGPTIVRSDGHRVPLSKCRRQVRWDPSTGVPGSDYAAIVALARDRDGYTYVIDVWMRVAKISVQEAVVWEMAERWALGGPIRATLESNNFQGVLARDFPRERAERKAAGKWHALHIESRASTTSKADDIAAMEAPITNGWLQFVESTPVEYDQQWDAFSPLNTRQDVGNDDGPDATARGYADFGGGAPGMSSTRAAA